jgi:hypothetical protein
MKTKKLKKPSKGNIQGSLDYRGMISNDSEFLKNNQELMEKIENEIALFTGGIKKIVEDYGRKVTVITSLEFQE